MQNDPIVCQHKSHKLKLIFIWIGKQNGRVKAKNQERVLDKIQKGRKRSSGPFNHVAWRAWLDAL